MNVWLRRFLVILTVGGGFAGLALTVQIIFVAQKPFWVTYAIALLFFALYAYGVFIGIWLSEGSRPVWPLLFYFALQIPFISSPIFTYRFCSGLQATVAIVGDVLSWDARLGSECRLAILSSATLGFGINLVALVVVLILTPHAFHDKERDRCN